MARLGSTTVNHFKAMSDAVSNTKKRREVYGNGQDKRAKKKKERRAAHAGGGGEEGDTRKEYDAPHPGSHATEDLADLDARNAALALSGQPPEPSFELPCRKKVALVLGYCGAAYQGMQINPGVR